MDYIFVEGFVNNCPSERCWDYDTSSNTCSLKDTVECTKLTCGATQMKIEFSKHLFGDEASAFALTSDTYEGDYDFGIVCDLGTCDMTTAVSEDKKYEKIIQKIINKIKISEVKLFESEIN